MPVLFFVCRTNAQSGWKQTVQYNLHVQFHPGEKSLDALMKMEYINHSPDTISFVWFQLWPNAYRNDQSPYAEQALENGDLRFYFSSREQKGYLNRLDFRVDGIAAITQNHPEYPDVIKLMLPKPLYPGDSISVSSSYHLRMPFNFDGNGYSQRHFEFRNWYPEPAVYDKKGWHPMPFLVQGGAYHEATDFTVDIEAPPEYVIAAGAVADTLSVAADKNRYRFTLHNANSFAWIADPHYHLQKDHMETNSGRNLNLQYFYKGRNGPKSGTLNSEVKKEIELLSKWLEPYPGETITIAEGTSMYDQDFSSLICIDPKDSRARQVASMRKKITAQWFQTLLLTDQRTQAWLSKGLCNYYSQRLDTALLFPKYPERDSYLWLRVAENERTSQPVLTATPDFSLANDSLIASEKAGLWFKQLHDALGPERFDSNMQKYVTRWSFDHPYPEDFKFAMDNQVEMTTDSIYKKLAKNETLFNPGIRRSLRPAFLFSSGNSKKYNYVGLAPVPGYNLYDGFMLGALIHNVNLPKNAFQFVLIPMYAFGSKSLVGLGRMSYSWKPKNSFREITIGVNGSHFDTNKATDSLGRPIFENFSKWVPYIRINLNPSGPRSSLSQWIDFKTYLITEKSFQQFAISLLDSLIHPNGISGSFRYLNQLSYHLEDNRSLYPYSLRADLQQSELFYRINLNLNYFLNYPEGGGLQVRFFAAKFGVWNSKNLPAVTRYEPKLLGVTGNEDYLYESYFIGRSASYAIENTSVPNGGLAAQQIMNRDGGLKLRADAYDFIQGKSDSWVSSLNFNTSLPAKLFPFPLPIRLFFDVGTYSEAWGNNPPTSRFLYVGGVQLSLFQNLLNIYAPLIYSSDFNEVLATTGFLKKITFSIDIQHINNKKVIRKLAEYE